MKKYRIEMLPSTLQPGYVVVVKETASTVWVKEPGTSDSKAWKTRPESLPGYRLGTKKKATKKTKKKATKKKTKKKATKKETKKKAKKKTKKTTAKATKQPADSVPYEITSSGNFVYISKWGTPSAHYEWKGKKPEKPYFWNVRDEKGRVLVESSRETAGKTSMDAWSNALRAEGSKTTKKKTEKRSGVVVECFHDGRKLRVRAAPGQGFDPEMNVQFPTKLRHEGCRYLVDDLDDKGSHYRWVGEIRPFEQGLGSGVRRTVPAPAPRRKRKAPSVRTGKPEVPALMLAHKWTESCDPRGWWISEKLDGVRAFWDGRQFVSRQGNVYYAPEWFKEGLPKDTPLDGELWVGRDKFQETVSIVRSHGMSDAWDRVRYLVFDAPDHPGTFEERLAFVKKAVRKAPYALPVKHYQCKGPGHMHHELSSVEKKGGEGLMLRRPGSPYERRRSRSLLKVKTFHDADAVITGYYPGKGKHKGVIGGFYVETLPDEAGRVRGGIKYKLGTGLTDEDRRDPPPIGSVITYRYQGLSKTGRPRFASFVRVRRLPRRKNPCLPCAAPVVAAGLGALSLGRRIR